MDLAGLIVGVIALIFGVACFLQVYCGRPALKFEADEFTGTEGRILVLAIKNQPVKNPILKLCRVTREVGNVLAYLDIQEQGTKKFVKRNLTGWLNCAATREIGILARALPGFTIGMTVVSTRNGQASIIDGKNPENLLPLPEGHYTAYMTILCGEHVHKFMQSFQVGQQDHLMIWYDRKIVAVK
jgi:hypothetical protein